MKKLRAGYSYVSGEDGHAVTDAVCVREGEVLDIRLLHGALRAEVREILPERDA